MEVSFSLPRIDRLFSFCFTLVLPPFLYTGRIFFCVINQGATASVHAYRAEKETAFFCLLTQRLVADFYVGMRRLARLAGVLSLCALYSGKTKEILSALNKKRRAIKTVFAVYSYNPVCCTSFFCLCYYYLTRHFISFSMYFCNKL